MAVYAWGGMQKPRIRTMRKKTGCVDYGKKLIRANAPPVHHSLIKVPIVADSE